MAEREVMADIFYREFNNGINRTENSSGQLAFIKGKKWEQKLIGMKMAIKNGRGNITAMVQVYGHIGTKMERKKVNQTGGTKDASGLRLHGIRTETLSANTN